MSKSNFFSMTSLLKNVATPLLSVFATTAAAQQRPNVVYVFPDQMRNYAMEFWRQPGFEGCINSQNDPVHTPNIKPLCTRIGSAHIGSEQLSVEQSAPRIAPYRHVSQQERCATQLQLKPTHIFLAHRPRKLERRDEPRRIRLWLHWQAARAVPHQELTAEPRRIRRDTTPRVGCLHRAAAAPRIQIFAVVRHVRRAQEPTLLGQ